jgi:hypothetical protein
VVEEYKIVPDFPNYSASNLGEVVNWWNVQESPATVGALPNTTQRIKFIGLSPDGTMAKQTTAI